MIKRIAALLLATLFTVPFLICSDKQNLSPKHKEWLELVSPIMTQTEKDVFFKLRSEREREKFIHLFWKRRDPLPDTEKNEFHDEYMKRVRFADKHFGFATSKRGSQTERGYFYLLLGPPLQREVYASHSKIWPLELWYYKGNQEWGLPPYFYLLFYQPQGIGEYRLFSPEVESPENLVIPSSPTQVLNRASAYQILRKISSELASASTSFIPAETSVVTTSLSTSTLLSNIHNLAQKKFSDAYARHFLTYKDYVETDYTHNYIESNSKIKVFQNNGQPYIHWALEPTQINFSEYQGKHYASFELILRVEDREGNKVLEKNEEIPLSVTPEKYKRHERQLFAFQDLLPIIPGKYKFFLLLKNKTTKDFTSFQKNFSVPPLKSSSTLSNLLLYLHHTKIPASQNDKLKAFALSGNQYIVNSQNHFLSGNNLGVYCQIYGIHEKEGKSLQIEILSLDTQKNVYTKKKPLTEWDSLEEGVDSGPISLSSFSPGYYTVKLSVLDSSGKILLSQKDNFILHSQHTSVVPWVYSKVHPAFPNSEHLYLLGLQYFNTQQYQKAKPLLEKTFQTSLKEKTGLLLAQTLFALGEHNQSLEVAQSIHQSTQNREASQIIAKNYAAQEKWTQALSYLEKLLREAQEIEMLNLAARCYLNLDQPHNALPLLQKSLKLNPQQQTIKDLEEKTKKQLK